MTNMSYCRFHNTLIEVEDCILALENREIISSQEKKKAKKLLKKFLEFCADEGIIEDFREDRIDEIVEECDGVDSH